MTVVRIASHKPFTTPENCASTIIVSLWELLNHWLVKQYMKDNLSSFICNFTGVGNTGMVLDFHKIREEVSCCWVPSHIGDSSNGAADSLAGLAVFLSEVFNELIR